MYRHRFLTRRRSVADPGNLGQLKTEEWEHLQQLADRLEQALTAADSADLTQFLPEPGTPHRLVYLHELIKTELEIRCRRNQAVSLDEYLRRYPELGAADALPADLVYEEYRVRHRYGDKPPLDVYRQRFPAQFEQLKKLEQKDPVATIYGTTAPGTVSGPSGDRRTDPTAKGTGPTNPAPEPLAPETLSNAPPVPKPPPPPPARPPGPSSSQMLPGGSYEQLDRIGKGQFGEVYRARTTGGVLVAVKKIFRSIDDDSSQREIKALKRVRDLRHPFLLQTFDFYPFDDKLIIVMELADGSLVDRFKECREAGKPGIPAGELLAYFAEAAEALDYLREQKLSHRDVKPQNLLHLKGHAKLADFGIARTQENTVDHTMNVGGTPAYMPPEMWRGDISVHSDQYSFAVTWYEMRTGRRIFHGKTQVDIAHQHLTDKPDVSGVPEPEQRVLLKALAKKPDERYPSCKAFVQDLAQALAPKPAPSPTPPRSRWQATLLTAALVVAASVLAAVLLKSLFTVRVDWQPEGWKPLTADVEKDVDGGTYYRRLVKDVGGQRVVMVLVPKKEASDPRTFYIMEDKVWNDLYKQFASDPAARAKLQAYADENPDTVKKLWVEGGQAPAAPAGKYPDPLNLGYEGPQARVPVFRVTVTEAYFFAEWLKGKLPTKRQWVRAAGGSLDEPLPNEKTTGPFEGDISDTSDLAVDQGATGPWPVGQSKRDVSKFGCRDMAGNGLEWTRDVQTADRKNLLIPLPEYARRDGRVYVVGKNYLDDFPPTTFHQLRTSNAAKEYLEASPYVSFRVVLERGE
jgi:serine/threonine protein kinase/formylglycine-generating enzyme required for sulfatase activity